MQPNSFGPNAVPKGQPVSQGFAVGQPVSNLVAVGQPVVAQPAVVMQPAMQELPVQIPAGVFPGQTIQVQTPSGQTVALQVPAGVQPGQTVMISVPTAPTMVMTQMAPPYGAPPGGHYENEQFCGVITILIAIFLVPCVCCCPCDSRQVYVAPDGRRFQLPGNEAGCECC